uniref:Uncharacterized protein n=1 Tax=Arundo donax TaxID=35708 RepID=A0A0A9CM18_ARUDO
MRISELLGSSRRILLHGYWICPYSIALEFCIIGYLKTSFWRLCCDICLYLTRSNGRFFIFTTSIARKFRAPSFLTFTNQGCCIIIRLMVKVKFVTCKLSGIGCPQSCRSFIICEFTYFLINIKVII